MRQQPVRILDGAEGTAARTRVLIQTSDGQKEWGTVGVSTNLLEASWQALVDSLAFPEQPGRAGTAQPAAPASTGDQAS